MRSFIISCVCIVLALTANAQTLNKKMGNPTMEEMNMTECDYDKEANAVVLYEDFDVQIVSTIGLKLKMVYKRRIKILKEDGLDYANVKLTLRDSERGGGDRDQLQGLKAFSYNLEGGKIQKTKMSGDMVSKKRLNGSFVSTEFTIPQAKVGSVIEYQYEIMRDALFDLPTWIAQSTCPVNYAHFRIALPDEFTYRVNQTGSVLLTANRDEEANTILGTRDVIYDFTGSNLPALPKDNEYIYCPRDFATKVTCELQNINIPGYVYKDYTTSQADVNDMLLKSEMFGGRLKQKNPFKEEVAAASIASLPTAMEKAAACAQLLKKHLRWNKEYALTGNSQSKVAKEGTGDNADLNFILISMLKDAGVEASPVVMSRRSRGRLPYMPSIDALNTFVIVFADEEGKLHYYDASAENGYIDALPTDLNVDRAILLKQDGSYSPVSLQDNIKRREIIMIDASLSADGLVSGNISRSYRDNAALRFRNAWEAKNDSAAFVADIAAGNNIDITEYETQGREEFSPMVTENYNFSRQLDAGDKYYISPLLFPFYDKNPFTAETSNMPIEFGAKGQMTISLKLALPEGYHLEEVPAPASMQLPDRGLVVRYVVSEADNAVNVNCRVTTNSLFFPVDSYQMVKEFYDTLVSKCSEMLVISEKPAE